MYLEASDLFALTIALFAVNFTLIIAFRRNYVLEKRLAQLDK